MPAGACAIWRDGYGIVQPRCRRPATGAAVNIMPGGWGGLDCLGGWADLVSCGGAGQLGARNDFSRGRALFFCLGGRYPGAAGSDRKWSNCAVPSIRRHISGTQTLSVWRRRLVLPGFAHSQISMGPRSHRRCVRKHFGARAARDRIRYHTTRRDQRLGVWWLRGIASVHHLCEFATPPHLG